MARTATHPGEIPDRAPRRHPNRRWWITAIVGMLVVVGLLVGIKAAQISALIKAGKSQLPPPETVSSAQAKSAEWPVTRTAVASVVAVRGVTLGSEVTGTVRQIDFESGATVRRNQPLLTLDTSIEEAQLAGALADDELAKVNLKRNKYLTEKSASPQVDLDAAVARTKQATSSVESIHATIAKKTIRAPFDGRVGIRQVELGQVVSSGTALVSLQSVDPIYAEFQLPQQALADLKEGQEVTLGLDIFPKDHWTGSVTTINPEVDPSTRNVRVRATLPNPNGRLLPGMFANVELHSGEARKVVVIPATAVLFAPYGDSVFVLDEAKDAAGNPTWVAHQKFVRTGEHRGDFVTVTSGLNPGDTVVSGGAFKLRNGAVVKVNNELAAPTSLAPSLPNN